MKKKKFFNIFALCIATLSFFGCTKANQMESTFKRGMDDYSFSLSSISATDRENRQIDPMQSLKTDTERYVGVFYWLWIGNNDHQFGVYDNTKLMLTPEGREALFSTENPPGDGEKNASPLTYMHWTNEPMFGYYNSSDPWIITRHIEMLTMAGVDFVFFDTTNSYTYAENMSQQPEGPSIKGSATAFLDTLLEYQNKGWNVPKVIFYTNTNSGDRVNKIFEQFYRSGKYEELWFKPNGKPMIVGTTEDNAGGSDMDVNKPNQYSNISLAMQEYFDVKESQWPTRDSTDVGFPWMSWEYPQAYHSISKTVNVSVAQHSKQLVCFNLMHKWSSKGYDYHKDIIEQNWAGGKNFENEWETVFDYEKQGKDVKFVTVTGWNEWVVQKSKDDTPNNTYHDGGRNPTGMMMVDNFCAEYSRDIEPDKTYYQDNFYLQLVRNIRKYKYQPLETENPLIWENKTIKNISDFDSINAIYKDFTGDARSRDFYGYDIRTASKTKNLVGSWYSDSTNRNDIKETRVCHDKKNIYFRVETVEDVTPYTSGDNWMNILVKTQDSFKEGFEGYNYLINRSPTGNVTTVERSKGGWNWEKTGQATMERDGKYLLITVPLASLGMDENHYACEFKVSDNVQKPSWYTESDPEHAVSYYYITGDSAPIGRLNYSYGY